MINFLVWLVGIITLATMLWRWAVRIPFWTYMTLSTPSRRLLYRYRHLPKAYRPDVELLPILKALDVKAGKNSPYEHYTKYESFKWHDCGSHHVSPFREYSTFNKEITSIEKAIAEREQLARESKITHNLDNVDLITQRLREESTIIRQVTKELQ
jgi:hypothetical protein